MKPKLMKKKNDPQLRRETGEAVYDGADFRTVTLLKNRFRIESILAVGGFGVIYTGKDSRLYNKKILIKANRYPRNLFKVQRNKALTPQVEKLRFRLEFERKMLLQAANRGISGTPVILDEIKDLGLDIYGPHKDRDGNHYHCTQKNSDGTELWTQEPFLVLSYVNGSPLNQIINQNWFRKNILGNTKQVILQIGRILKGFHLEKSVDKKRISFVYQDLKPDNIMFTDEKNFVLIDFGGFAVRVDGKTLTRFAKTGTPGYQPPEFADYAFAPEKIDPRADIFSLGATVYHLLTGKSPGADSQGRAVFDQNKLKTVQGQWKNWIVKAIAPKPDDRYPTMEAAIQDAHTLPMK